MGLLFASFLATNANALPIGIYVGARGGVNTTDLNNKVDADNFIKGQTNPFASANAGIKFLKLRGEFEYIYRYNALDLAVSGAESKETSIKQAMVNVYYDFFSFFIFSLYVNGGIGQNKISSQIISSYDKTVWSAGLGATMSLLIFKIDLGYRYFDMGKISFVSPFDSLGGIEQKSHDVYLGLRLGF
jgi:opacity protein-like surface antigen